MNARTSPQLFHDLRWMRQLVWVYFWLLLFEGALRKWVLPSLANPLLIVRDPVVLLLYFLAWKNGVFPRNPFIFFGVLLAIITLFVGSLAPDNTVFVALYGARTNFLHLPLIFLIPRVFEARDVHRVGFWVLVIAIPMALLMALQFRSAPGSWINAGTEGNFIQIRSEAGRIRAPGTFSFITGPTLFYSLTAAFLLSSQFVPKRYPLWLLIAATLSLIVATAVSSSRSLLAGIAVVVMFAVSCMILRMRVTARMVYSFGAVVVFLYLLSKLPFVQEGITIFSARVASASVDENQSGGLLTRFLGSYTSVIPLLFDAPAFGRGLGMGTNVGAALLSGKAQFLLAELEWQRHVLESGPLLGGLFILYRIILTSWIGLHAARFAVQRDPLPFLLFGVCVLNLLNGQWSQSTMLGFTIFVGGLCLAATRVPLPASQPQARRKRPLRGSTSLPPRYEKTQSAVSWQLPS